MTQEFATLAEFKAAHKAADGHFFSRGAMLFFESRVESGLLKGGYFITSESYGDGSPRFYQVRQVDPADLRNVETIGGHYEARDAAMDALREHRR